MGTARLLPALPWAFPAYLRLTTAVRLEHEMQSTTLSPGVTSTRIGFGCAGLMREPSARKRQALLAEAFDQGINHFDVARMYGLGAAEKELGNFARGRREHIVIATKFGIEPASAPGRLAHLQGPVRRLLARYPALRRYVKRHSDDLHRRRRYDATAARTSLQTSLRELQIDYVDLLFIHDPSPVDEVDIPGICAYMEEAQKAGLVRAWGVAGERDPCARIGHLLPKTTVLQTRDDVLSRASPLPRNLEPLVTFGVLGEALDRITRYICASPERRAQWSEALNLDCSSSQALAALLLREALDVNRRGVVLFSTTRPERLRGLAAIAAAAMNTDDEPMLAEFRRQVRAVPAPTS